MDLSDELCTSQGSLQPRHTSPIEARIAGFELPFFFICQGKYNHMVMIATRMGKQFEDQIY